MNFVSLLWKIFMMQIKRFILKNESIAVILRRNRELGLLKRNIF
jgi:hypothetical protein